MSGFNATKHIKPHHKFTTRSEYSLSLGMASKMLPVQQEFYSIGVKKQMKSEVLSVAEGVRWNAVGQY